MRNFFRTVLVFTFSITLLMPVFAVGQRGVQVEKGPAALTFEDLGEYHAVIIGINNYKHFSKLKTAVKDAEALQKILTEHYGFASVTLITDDSQIKPTSSGIQRAIRTTASRLTEKDNLLIYYAGHGHVDELTEDGFWIPIDGKEGDLSTWIPHTHIRSLLESGKVKVKNFILIADSCYSGIMLKRSAATDAIPDMGEEFRIQKLKERASRKSREVITSGGNEPVADIIKGSEHSLFAHYLLRSLEENQRRYVDLATLFNQEIQPKVDAKGIQRPDRFRVQSTVVDDGGLFVLAKLTAKESIPSLKLDMKEEMQKLKSEREALLKELAEQKKTAEQEKAKFEAEQKKLIAEKGQLTAMAEKKKAEEAERETLLKQLAEQKKKAEQEMGKLEVEQNKLMDEKNRLAALEQKNSAEEERLKALLTDKEKGIGATAGMMAEIQREKQRIAEEKRKIEAEKEKLVAKERSQSEMESLLKQGEDKRRQQEEAEVKMLALIRKESDELEKKKKMIEEEGARVEVLLAKAKETQGTVQIDIQAMKDRFLMLDDGTVIDKKTNLMWLQNANYPLRGMDWEGAMGYVDKFKYAGYADWRLPSREEWKIFIDKGGIDATYPGGHPFANIIKHGGYWSSSYNPLGASFSYVINTANGSVTFSNKAKVGYIWPVRHATEEDLKKMKK